MNFDYYNVIFIKNHISEGIYGLIYSSFMLINYFGIKIFKQYHTIPKIEFSIFFCLPLTFIFITFNHLLIVGIAIILQQIVYSYLFIRFDIYIIEYIQHISQGTHFQSLISFWYSLFKSMLLLGISLFLKYINLYYFYYIIALLLFIIIYMYGKKKLRI